MATMQLPKTLAELTPEFLTSALRSSGALASGAVTAVSATPIGQGVGLLCQIARLELQYDHAAPGAPVTMVAKLPTTVPETRAMVAAFGFYERETLFYQLLAPRVALRTPAVHYAAYEGASGDFLLLLEDLSHLRLGDQTSGCALEEAELAVRELARLHAQWWNSPELATLGWLPTAEDPRNAAGLALYPHAWPVFLQRFGAALPAEILTAGEQLGAQATAILARFSSGPRTICHGDPRLDNMFFAAGPGDPPFTMIDWQIAVQGVGTYDIGYFLTQSIDPALRREKELDWLRLYHSLLVEGGVKDYSFDECREHYRWTALFCFAYPVMGGGLGDIANDRALALGRAMTERSITAILDWKAHELLAAG